MKTVRFTKIVETAGKPELHVPLVDPKRDRALARPIREHRVMTVHQTTKGNAKDYGTVGLTGDRHAQILVFKKSLRRFEDRRVIGINYDLVADATLTSLGKSGAHGALASPSGLPAAPRAHAEDSSSVNATEEVQESVATKSGAAKSTRRKNARAPKHGAAGEERDGNRAVFPAAKIPAPVLKEIRSALRELKAGKAVAAYERLESLMDSAE